MTAHEYLENVLNSHALNDWEVESLRNKRSEIETYLRSCFGQDITNFYYSGSIAKGTAIRLSYDLDLCVYFKRDSFDSLRDMYEQVYTKLDQRYSLEPKTVSIAIKGSNVDIVPPRRIDETGVLVNLYRRDIDSQIQTSISIHVKTISASGVRNIIKLIKIWKQRHNLHFKSFALELLVIKSLKDKVLDGYDNKVWEVLKYIRDDVLTVRLEDPANSNNVVSDVILGKDKQAMTTQAIVSLNQGSWSDIIW